MIDTVRCPSAIAAGLSTQVFQSSGPRWRSAVVMPNAGLHAHAIRCRGLKQSGDATHPQAPGEDPDIGKQ
jgi:hypothetical protein